MRPWLAWGLKLGLVGLVILAGFAIYLDAVVQEKFSGKRWTIPAKVYARPLELFVGQKLAKDDFLRELDALGYRRESVVNGPGAVSVAGNSIELHSRGFQFYEGAEPAQRVRVRFSGDYVAGLTQANGSNLAVARLEPVLIGGLYPAHQEDRILIKLDQVPTYLIEALVAVEDRDYFDHFGVSPKGIARAMWVNATSGRVVQGGSTLTQQLVKNFYLTNERTLARKATEAMMAVLLELHYDKQEILEAYMNEVFLGQDGQRAIHGFGLASQYFFSQPVSELKLEQVALLVGMVKGPTFFNPRRNPERALARRNLVIDLLAEQGSITADEAAAAKQKPLGVTSRGSMADSSFPAFLDLVKRQLREDYRDQDLTEEGLRIFTSLDPILQLKAEEALAETLKRLAGRKGVDAVQAGMVVTNPETGEIQALIGSRQPRFAGFNRALDAVRPIGSLVKPAIYLSALERPS
ncbi:MAG: penicillin-binding protein 1B, partial [Pseudomonas sp. 34-62-33]